MISGWAEKHEVNDIKFEDRFGLTSLNEVEILKNVY